MNLICNNVKIGAAKNFKKNGMQMSFSVEIEQFPSLGEEFAVEDGKSTTPILVLCAYEKSATETQVEAIVGNKAR
jgi:hypothetical protein